MSSLRAVAWATAALNAAGLLMAVAAMWPGAPDAPRPARLEFLAARPLGWTLGWLTWMLAAVALVAFFARLSRALRADPAGPLALVLVAMGAAVDLLCDAVQVTVVPLAAELAVRGADGPFDLLERATWAGGVVVGCGLYCLGVGVATAGIARREAASLPLLVASAGTLAGGLVWVVAELALVRPLLAPATAVTVGSFIAWSVVVPSALSERERRAGGRRRVERDAGPG